MDLTEEDAKGVQRIVGLRGYDYESDLIRKAKKYLNCKYMMDTFGLIEEEVKEMEIYDDDTEEDLKKKTEEYISRRDN